MPTIDIWFLRGRRGTSTIMGTLIFVGILFTAVIPTFLVMKQADTFYEKMRFELGRLDEEQRREELYVYVYTKEDPRSLTVKVQNKGELSVRIVRLWINDDPIPLDYPVQPMSDREELYPYLVPEESSSYYITVTTDRGNSIAYDTPLKWVYLEGWEADVFSINVLICALPGHQFKIVVSWVEGEEPISMEKLAEKFDPKFFVVDDPDIIYTVTIYRGCNPIYTKVVEIPWSSEGLPVEWVFA